MLAETILILAVQCAPQVNPNTILAIVATEAAAHALGGYNEYSININDKSQRRFRQPKTIAEAVKITRQSIKNGQSVDIGLMQVNTQHLEKYKVTATQLFDPCTNIRVGGAILTDYYLKTKKSKRLQNRLFVAFSLYNTGNSLRGFKNGYVSKVVNSARLLQDNKIILEIDQ